MRARLVTAAVLLVVSLAACVPGPTPDPADSSPLPSPTPLFADEEAALAAAERAYSQYTAMSDTILHEGGKDPDRIADFATGDYLESSLESFQRIADRGLHTVGDTDFRDFRLQAFDPYSESTAVVIAYVCEDISRVDLVDSSGQSLVAADRQNTGTMQVVFDARLGSVELLISSRELWSEDPC